MNLAHRDLLVQLVLAVLQVPMVLPEVLVLVVMLVQLVLLDSLDLLEELVDLALQVWLAHLAHPDMLVKMAQEVHVVILAQWVVPVNKGVLVPRVSLEKKDHLVNLALLVLLVAQVHLVS